MTLKEIDKSQYRQRMNKVMIAFIALFAGLSVGFGQLLILLFSAPDADNFKFNLFGVVLALLLCSAIVNSIKNKEYFADIYYVWKLKQLHNKIFRKLKNIKAAADDNQVDAINILYFYYTSLRFVYLLDDNTLTIKKVNQDYAYVQGKIEKLRLSHEQLNFTPEMLERF